MIEKKIKKEAKEPYVAPIAKIENIGSPVDILSDGLSLPPVFFDSKAKNIWNF